MSRKTSGHGGGHSRKHTSQHKHSGTRKHHPQHHRKPPHHKSPYAATPLTVKGVHTKHPKARGLALGSEWECCSAEALGASLRLAGWPVGEEDVLALHVAAGGSRDAGVPIVAVLEAASAVGLAGVRPRGWWPLEAADFFDHGEGEACLVALEGVTGAGDLAGAGQQDGFGGHSVTGLVAIDLSQQPARGNGAGRELGVGLAAVPGGFHGLILGAELPGPHALAVDGGGVWSWGEWHPWSCFPDAVLEEAWEMVWPC